MQSVSSPPNCHFRGAVLLGAAALLGPLAGRGLASDHGGHADAEEDVFAESASGFRGVELGEFSIRTIRSVPARRDEVTFTLHATVKIKEFNNFDKLFGKRSNKVRDQVIAATRLVPIEDYDDPELTKLRRRILLRLRRTLPELVIDDVYVSDFNLSVNGL
jgi:hypothetical protein